MEEIIKLVMQKTGINEEQARGAVTAVIDFLKQKLPAPIAGQIDGVLSGSGVGDALKGLGGLFGKK